MGESPLRPSARILSLQAIAPRAFKRSLFGYRRSDVDEAIEWRDAALEEETKRANDQTSRADLLSVRVDDETQRAAELERASLDLAARANAIEQVADRLALRVVERDREIETLTARVDAALEELRVRVEADRIEEIRGNGVAADEADVFDGLIEVEVGPLSDFDQLASFEDAANAIGAAEEISVKRFKKGRATLEMQLSEPVALLMELEERVPFEFTVRDTRNVRVVLDVDGE